MASKYRIMKKVLFLLFIIIFGIIQVTSINYFNVFGIRPDLLLISVCLASLFFEFKWAFVFSICAGLFKDAFSINTFALNTLLFPFWCFLISRAAAKIDIDNNFMRIVLIFLVTVIHNIITGLIFISSGNLVPLGVFLRIVALGSIYTALAALLVLKIWPE